MNFKAILDSCKTPAEFKQIFVDHLEEVKANPSLVFKRLEAAQNFTDSFYAHLQDEVAVLLTAMPLDEPAYVSPKKISPKHTPRQKPSENPPDEPVRSLASIEKEHILYAIRYHDFHIQETADALGISERTLRDKLDIYVGKRTRLPNGSLRYLVLSHINSGDFS